jgi:alpha-ketoglutarate-dependent taurine dioxygenase
VASELGELRSTSWGTVFDVVSMVDANSVAYTNLPLVTHTDEGYRDPAPTIQLTHFLRSDATGGQATLTDGFKVATDLREQHPEMFDLLASHVLHFHFADATAEHEADGPVIVTEPGGRLRAIRYSNHSAQPFMMDPDLLEAYYAAYRTFGRMRESEQYQVRVDMQAGDMYMVDNHRVMHGRTAFSSGGSRHLQSCYIERDELISRLTVLDRRLGATSN